MPREDKASEGTAQHLTGSEHARLVKERRLFGARSACCDARFYTRLGYCRTAVVTAVRLCQLCKTLSGRGKELGG